MSEKRKPSSRSTAVASRIQRADRIEEKTLRKEIRRALRAETKSEADEKLLETNSRQARVISRQLNQHASKRFKMEETFDTEVDCRSKLDKLAEMITQARHCIVYTGAGISTAANIPDYRGADGVWTSIQNNEAVKKCNLTTAEPTYSHMALRTLIQSGHVKYILSQNCDGLHIRSGVPERQLSEIHGNMYLETCKDEHAHYRAFDVTEKTNVKRHKTGRSCQECREPLADTIVHFGEMNRTDMPYRWLEAEQQVRDCDLIITIGTSLKVLKAYKCLWPKSVKIVVVNLQWTPKTKQASLVINQKSDMVLSGLLSRLNLTPAEYKMANDQLAQLARPMTRDDHAPVTPMAEFVPLFKGEHFPVESELYETNKTDDYMPGWYGKGLKKT